jgi:hypothetical protein
MTKQGYYRLTFGLSVIAFLQFLQVFPAQAQEAAKPELSVAGVKLGDRMAAKAFLSGYQPRRGEDGRPNYFFYNKFGTQVMRLAAASDEEPYFITEIEVFAVGKSYQTKNFVADQIGFFETESKIFIGEQQSATSLIFGVPYRIGAKDLVKKKGAPTEQAKTDDRETITYNIPAVELTDEAGKTTRCDYFARYEFYKKRLRKFTLRITAAEKPKVLF